MLLEARLKVQYTYCKLIQLVTVCEVVCCRRIDKCIKVCEEAVLMALSVCWLYLCHGFVFLSSAAAGTGSQLFEPASALTYSYQSTLLLNEVTPDLGKDVGFRVTAQLSVETVWQSASSPDTKLLLLKVLNKCYLL